MTTGRAPYTAGDSNAFVSTDIVALAAHMNGCEGAHGPLLPVRSALEWVMDTASGHIITTAALVGIIGLCLLLALA